MEPPSKRLKRNTAAYSTTRLFNADSPITRQGTDIQSFLSGCMLHWDRYGEDEKQSIISSLPPAYRSRILNDQGQLICPLVPHFVAQDTGLRDQIARFKRDVGDGFYTKTWQDKAAKAMEERANGRFDEYLAQHAEAMFADGTDAEENATGSSDGEFGRKRSKNKGHKKRSKVSSRMRDEMDVGEHEHQEELV